MAPIRLKDAGENRIAYLGLAFTFFFLSWYTWGHWGNLRVDMGRELYVPSSLLNGKLLYRDLWYPYGPLTPYLQALLYRLFGLHWNVLYLFGLATTLSCTFLLFTISRRFVSPTAAFLVPFCFLMQVRIPAQAATRIRFIPPPDSDSSRHPIPIDSAMGIRSIPPPPGECR
jgi:hypothetical protein